jgi:tetratricopeptide (TPR) repeat protein
VKWALPVVFLLLLATAGCNTVKAGDSSSAEKQESFSRILGLLKESDYERVGMELKKLLALDPRFVPAHRLSQDLRLRLLARVQVENQEMYEREIFRFLGYYKSLLSRNPDDALYHYLFGRALFLVGDRKSAEREIEKALEFDPKFVPALLVKASFAGAAGGDNKQARKLVEQALALDPKSSDALNAMALLEGDAKKAVSLLKKAWELDSSNTAALLNVARVQMSMGEQEEALKSVELALKADPELEEAHLMKGAILLAMNMVEKAIPELEKEIALHTPYGSEASFKLAEIYARRGEYEKAVERLNHTIKWSRDDDLVQAAKKALEVIQSLQKKNPQ